MPHSHHSHSGQFCRHAKDTLEAVVIEAIRQGFQVYGLSEHAPRYRYEDLFPEESDLTPSELFDAYLSFLSEAVRLRTKYQSQITLLIGIETDYITALDSAGLSHLLSTQHEVIDYTVGSVHHVDGVSIDFDRPTWLRAVRHLGAHSTTMSRTSDGGVTLLTADESDPRVAPSYTPNETELGPFIAAYLDAQYDLLRSHQPEVVGHFDLCLLFTPDISLASPSLVGPGPGGEGEVPVWDKVIRNVKYAVEYGALFEANAAAIRKGWKGSYPSSDVIELIQRLGGRICLSDDSHGTSYVGLNYLPMRDYLVRSGVSEVWHLVPSTEAASSDEAVGKRGRVVARRLGEWTAHPFWEKLQAKQAQA